ncbi:MAG: hypothetical protein GY847_14395 [Proteobacteria bacterium]|nr:hypothetical protein [Pseudomonadota bacterium]
MDRIVQFIKVQNELNGLVGNRITALEKKESATVTHATLMRFGILMMVMGMFGDAFAGWKMPGAVIIVWFGINDLAMMLMRWVLARRDEGVGND